VDMHFWGTLISPVQMATVGQWQVPRMPGLCWGWHSWPVAPGLSPVLKHWRKCSASTGGIEGSEERLLGLKRRRHGSREILDCKKEC
jgi:hypothetical protein